MTWSIVQKLQQCSAFIWCYLKFFMASVWCISMYFIAVSLSASWYFATWILQLCPDPNKNEFLRSTELKHWMNDIRGWWGFFKSKVQPLACDSMIIEDLIVKWPFHVAKCQRKCKTKREERNIKRTLSYRTQGHIQIFRQNVNPEKFQ